MVQNPPAIQEMQVFSLWKIPCNGNGSPLQDTCLGDPMDGGAWWAEVFGVSVELDTTEWLSNDSELFVHEATERMLYPVFLGYLSISIVLIYFGIEFGIEHYVFISILSTVWYVGSCILAFLHNPCLNRGTLLLYFLQWLIPELLHN